jgi:hypothetical protein
MRSASRQSTPRRKRGNATIIGRLIASGAKANGTDRSGDTVLMAAVRSGSLEAVTALVDAGADVNAADPQLGHTVLMWAVRSDSAAIARLLLARGASLEARTRTGAKPAARPPGAGGGSHGVGIVRSGVPPQGEQLPTPGGMTPLLYAARDGALEAARVLVDAGANLNAADPNGMTPLMMAITNGQIRVAQLLVDKGADGPRGRLVRSDSALGGRRNPQPRHAQQVPRTMASTVKAQCD